jgi:hypothetical protein
MVHETMFGREASRDGIRFRPWITRGMHRAWFADAETIVLDRVPWRGRSLTVVVHLPPPASANGEGAYEIASVVLDGREIGDAFVTPSASARFEITLRSAPPHPAAHVRKAQALFAPKTPLIRSLTVDEKGAPVLAFDRNGEAADAIVWNVYRDGREIAHHLAGTVSEWRDPDGPKAITGVSPCWAIEAVFPSSGNASYHSRPACWFGAKEERVLTFAPNALDDVRVRESGEYALQLVASNPGDVTTGVTCAVRHVVIGSNEGYVFVPHSGPAEAHGRSSFVRVRLEANRSYRITIDQDAYATNMSSFAHFERYTRERGGRGGPENTMTLESVRLYPRAVR